MKKVCLLTVVALGWAVPSWAAPPQSAYHVVVPQRALSAGEQVEVRLEPAPPSGTYIYWRNAAALSFRSYSDDAHKAIYTAPFVIVPGSPAADIRVDLSGAETGRVGFDGHVDLAPSSLPLSDECLGTGQSFSTDHGSLEPYGSTATENDFRRLEGIAVHMSDPEYPRVAVIRGLTGTVVVRAVVCKTGRVLAAFLQPASDNDGNLIPFDRVFTDAALAIVLHQTFEPYVENGVALAEWRLVTVDFRR